jgi:hypothetical protein
MKFQPTREKPKFRHSGVTWIFSRRRLQNGGPHGVDDYSINTEEPLQKPNRRPMDTPDGSPVGSEQRKRQLLVQ